MTLVLDASLAPEEAAAALRQSGETRVVLVARDSRVRDELVTALRRAGAEPFGIHIVSDAADRSVDAARARLDALPPDERGRPRLNGGAISRRSLFSSSAVVAHVPVAVLDERACIGTARCSICVERCPEQAIASTSPLPTVDPGACAACGLCVARCPHGALRLSGASTEQIEAQLNELVPGVEGIVFGPAAAPPGWAAVDVPTPNLVSLGWLLQLRARGVEAQGAPGGVAELARTLPVVRPLTLTLTEPAATVEALDVQGDAVEDEASPLGIVELDVESCTLCGACVTACPTEALRLDDGVDETTVSLRAALCVPCGRCAPACPEDAITVRPGIDRPRIRAGATVLAASSRERCSGCGAELPPRPMRRRIGAMLGGGVDAPLDLCARCAARAHR